MLPADFFIFLVFVNISSIKVEHVYMTTAISLRDVATSLC